MEYVETIPLPFTADRTLVPFAPPTISVEGSITLVNPSLVDVRNGGISHDDPPPQTSKDE